MNSCPRILITWSFRTTELRSTTWESHTMPSATVNTGCRCSSSAYSLIRNEVVSHVVSCIVSRWTKSTRAAAAAGSPPYAPWGPSVRNESTTTIPGW